MSNDTSNALARGIRILECLFENDFQGKTELEINMQTGIPLTTVYRHLNTLKSSGWVIDVPIDGVKTRTWKVDGKRLVGIAFKFKKAMLNQVHSIENEFYAISGEELRDV